MRRKDREMDKEFAFTVIDKATYGIISTVDEDNMPYAVPLSIVRNNNNLYFHSAKSGKKVSIFKDNPNVSITFVGNTKIPEIYTVEELDAFITDEKKAKQIANKLFTTEYESALAQGKVKLVEDENEKINALRLICEKYTPDKMAYFPIAIKTSLQVTNVYKIEIESVTAKRKKL